MRVQRLIREKLESGLRPVSLDIVDESHHHAGHVGAKPEGETHFRIKVISPLFHGQSRVKRQQMVYGLLKEELAGPIHALAFKGLFTPEEIQ